AAARLDEAQLHSPPFPRRNNGDVAICERRRGTGNQPARPIDAKFGTSGTASGSCGIRDSPPLRRLRSRLCRARQAQRIARRLEAEASKLVSVLPKSAAHERGRESVPRSRTQL